MKKLALLFGITCWAVAAFAQTKTANASDESFVKYAAKGGMMEVSSGKLAAFRGNSSDVKTLGERLVRINWRENKKLTKLAAEKGIKLPDAPDDNPLLSKENGAKFDRDYITIVLKNHRDNVAKFEKALDNLTDPDIRAYAESALTVLKDHLAKIEAIAARMGISGDMAIASVD